MMFKITHGLTQVGSMPRPLLDCQPLAACMPPPSSQVHLFRDTILNELSFLLLLVQRKKVSQGTLQLLQRHKVAKSNLSSSSTSAAAAAFVVLDVADVADGIAAYQLPTTLSVEKRRFSLSCRLIALQQIYSAETVAHISL